MKTLHLLAAAAATLTLAGCREATDLRTTDAWRVNFGGTIGYSYVSVFTDPVTGCDYFMTDDGFLSPRLMPDGSQRCTASAGSSLAAPAPSITAPPPALPAHSATAH